MAIGTVLRTRVPPEMAQAVAEAALRSRVDISTWLRWAVEDRLGDANGPTEFAVTPPPENRAVGVVAKPKRGGGAVRREATGKAGTKVTTSTPGRVDGSPAGCGHLRAYSDSAVGRYVCPDCKATSVERFEGKGA